MHEVKERVHSEIKEILESELTPKSVTILGELVDIVKDIKYMDYLDCKMKRYSMEMGGESGYDTKGFVKDLHDYEMKRADFLKSKDATRKTAMQNSLSAMIEKYGNTLKEMWDLFSLEEEKEIVRKYV